MTGEEAAVPVTLPGVDVAVYPVIALLPVQDGAEKVTLTPPPVAASVAVPIVGAPGLRGQTLAPTDCICWETVQIPLAVLVDVVGAVAEMTPPL